MHVRTIFYDTFYDDVPRWSMKDPEIDLRLRHLNEFDVVDSLHVLKKPPSHRNASTHDGKRIPGCILMRRMFF